MKIVNIYVRINGYLFQGINIHRKTIDNQHLMLGNPVFHNISIDTYKQEILPTFMFAYGVYITRPLN